jgi:hypothetical protein
MIADGCVGSAAWRSSLQYYISTSLVDTVFSSGKTRKTGIVAHRKVSTMTVDCGPHIATIQSSRIKNGIIVVLMAAAAKSSSHLLIWALILMPETRFLLQHHET